MASLITLGLSQIMVGTAAPTEQCQRRHWPRSGKRTRILAKWRKTLQMLPNILKKADRPRKSARKQRRFRPLLSRSWTRTKLSLQSMLVVLPTLQRVGDSTEPEVVANVALKVETEQGLDISIPNADVEAVINADFSAKGIFLVDFTVTPCAVSSGKAIWAKAKQPNKRFQIRLTRSPQAFVLGLL